MQTRLWEKWFQEKYDIKDFNLTDEYKELNLWEINIILAKFLEKFKRFPIISITWPAWVGKTTITETISKFLWAKIYRELPEINPFLAIISTTKWKAKDTLWYPNQSLFCTQDAAIITDWFVSALNTPIVFDFAITQTKAFWNIKLKWREKKNFNSLFEWIYYWTKNWFWW
jgi:deoxyadenosine/deoxycytidine kinase